MSGTLTLKRELKLNEDYDVIVIGGGPAGCTAAAAAARDGSKTLLVEATGSLGGMGTSGLVPAWCPFTDKEKVIYCGMAEQVLRDCIAGTPHLNESSVNWTPIDPELLKRIYDDLVTEAGADVLFNSNMCALETDGEGNVTSLVLSDKRGLTAYKASIYIDCSGDADLAAWAGAEFLKGDEDGDMQPATHCFALANVDMYGYSHCGTVRYGEGETTMDKIIASGKYPLIPDRHACNNVVGPGVIGFNAGHIWDVDNTDPTTVSKALIEGRKMAASFRDALAEFFPEAFAASYLVHTGSLLGIRETRRIIGDYVLTKDDFFGLRSFDDEICRNSYFIDVHHTKKQIGTPKELGEGHGRLGPGESHGIPYRCLLPKGLNNVLVAGRSISTDRPVQGSTRVMPVCLAMGEAAGAAAAMAVETGDTRAVDTQALRERLREAGAYLP